MYSDHAPLRFDNNISQITNESEESSVHLSFRIRTEQTGKVLLKLLGWDRGTGSSSRRWENATVEYCMLKKEKRQFFITTQQHFCPPRAPTPATKTFRIHFYFVISLVLIAKVKPCLYAGSPVGFEY
jgi:hypothetical protein